VGEPQIAAAWNKDFHHMLPLAACHHSSQPANITLQLKEGKLPDQCFSYSPCQGCMGNLTAAPARSQSRVALCGEGALGCWVVLGVWTATFPGPSGSGHQTICLQSTVGSRLS
jgi:hypothetical protein